MRLDKLLKQRQQQQQGHTSDTGREAQHQQFRHSMYLAVRMLEQMVLVVSPVVVSKLWLVVQQLEAKKTQKGGQRKGNKGTAGRQGSCPDYR